MHSPSSPETVEVVVARRFLLDDALIHVRSADLLLQAGFPTADGVSRSFANSSPLFLLLTAAGLALGGTFYVTKMLSLAAFGALVAVLIVAAWRERHPPARWSSWRCSCSCCRRSASSG